MVSLNTYSWGRASSSNSQQETSSTSRFSWRLRTLDSLFILLGCACLMDSAVPLVRGQQLSDAQINLVSARLTQAAQASWELGTRSQAILELNATSYSVFSSTSLPPPASVPSELTEPLQPFFAIAQKIVGSRNSSSNAAQPLMADGSAADPASNGMCVLLANWTGLDGGRVDYAGAAKGQLDFLFSSSVPKTADGAFSHRVEQVQLWSDFAYMVPPFLAYYGAVTQNRTLLAEAYNQIKLYRSYLRDSKSGMWRHVVMGTTGNDEGFWSTGNGWAAAGMLRVYATIRNSEYANTLKKEQKDLAKWVAEIHSGVYRHLDDTNLFTNYANQPPSAPGNFYDGASTALLAATVYRASTLLSQHKYVPYAERSRKALFAESSNSTSSSSPNATSSPLANHAHFTQEGWLTPVVNPHSYGLEGRESAEGQAFVVMLHAAWRDWEKAGAQGANAAAAAFRGGRSGATVAVVICSVLLGVFSDA